MRLYLSIGNCFTLTREREREVCQKGRVGVCVIEGVREREREREREST